LGYLSAAAEGWNGPLPDWAAALCLGVACHSLTDSVFHPLVYHYCGVRQRHRGATLRHYQFETAMDLHYMSMAVTPWRGRLIHLLPYGPRWQRFLRAVGLIYFGDDRVPDRIIGSTVARHAIAQRLFYANGLRSFLDSLGKVPGIRTGEITALCYPHSPGAMPFLDGTITYRHPVSGEPRAETLMDLEDRAAALIHAVFDAFEGGRPDADTLKKLVGPSAETGLPVEDNRPMEHFAIRRILRLMGRR
jgi:hypothetical protein